MQAVRVKAKGAGGASATGHSALPSRHAKDSPGLSRRQRVFLSLIVVGSLVTGAIVAHALWSATATLAGGIISSGDLDAAWVPDSLRWTETSDWQESSDTQAGTTVKSLADHRFGPGDQLLIEQDFTVSGHGDNLIIEFGLDTPNWSANPSWQTSWMVVDGQGVEVGPGEGPSAVSQTITAAPLPVGEDTYTMQLFVEWPDAAELNWALDGHSNTVDAWPFGQMRLSVNQVRGAGA